MSYEHTANWRKLNPDKYRAGQRALMARRRAALRAAKPIAEQGEGKPSEEKPAQAGPPPAGPGTDDFGAFKRIAPGVFVRKNEEANG